MTAHDPRDDPSTAQIMASIARIVSEGESREAAADEGAPGEGAVAPAEGDDVLDLVDMVDERGNVIPLPRAHGNAPPPEGGDAAGTGASEEQVLEALRPMLQTWLDTHMPPIVERLVRREIERAQRRPEPE